MVLLSRLLLTLSENELFMAMLVDMPAGGGVGVRNFAIPPSVDVRAIPCRLDMCP